MGRKKQSKKFGVTKYLPVLIILLSITIMVGSTFAYFTDKKEEVSELTFSKVELSSETTIGIDGELRDVIPGTKLVDGEVAFSKSIDSEAIYVRAKLSFSLAQEFALDADMQAFIKELRNATDFNIITTEQHGAVWSAKDGNYFYLMEKPAEGEPTNLMRVDTIDTFVLSNEVVVPRDLESLPNNAQYMKSINFHIAFEAIQADNVSNVLSETKETFNVLFPTTEAEKYVVENNDDDKIIVTLKGFDGASDVEVEINAGEPFNKPVVDMPVDGDGTSTHAIVGWYTDSEFTNAYEFGNVVEESVTLYPKALAVSQGLAFYAIKENGVTVAVSVKKGTCIDAEIVVPNTYRGKPIIKIDSEGFRDLTTLENVYLPETITNIGAYAFYGCTNLALTSLPMGLTSIGQYAFQYCTNLALTSLPDGVTGDIGNHTFYNCTNLALTSLPSGITRIGHTAFSQCASLALTSLPSGLISIDDWAFSGCINLKLTSLPMGVTSIGDYVFYGCANLALTELPSGITSIGTYAFEGCTNLALTELPSDITSIGTYAFRGCTNLALTSLPMGVTSIGDYVFYGCVNLVLSELPNGVTSIGGFAFYYCSKLALSKLPSSLTSIGNFVFYGCINLTLISLSSSLTSIGDKAFNGCTNLNYILCETEEVANLASGKGRDNVYIYSLQESGYESGAFDTEVVINDSVTIYTATVDGYKWVRTSDNKYYKCIVTA